MRKHNFNDNTEAKNKNIGFILLKYSFVPIIIFAAFLAIFLVLTPIQNKHNKHYITPYTDSVTKQDSDLYIVFPYYDGHYLCAEFLQTLNNAEEEYGIDYYLIDINKYPDVLEEWEVEVWPTYFVFYRESKEVEEETKTDAKLLYKSYGNKEAKALNNEINNVKEYGMPINELNKTITISDSIGSNVYSINVQKVTLNLENDKQFSLTISITNLTEEIKTISLGDFVIYHNSWDENDSNYKYTNLDEKEKLTLDEEETKTIEIMFEGVHPYYELDIMFNYENNSEEKYVWTYKMWPIK